MCTYRCMHRTVTRPLFLVVLSTQYSFISTSTFRSRGADAVTTSIILITLTCRCAGSTLKFHIMSAYTCQERGLIGDQCPRAVADSDGSEQYDGLQIRDCNAALIFVNISNNPLSTVPQGATHGDWEQNVRESSAHFEKLQWLYGGYALGACEALYGESCTTVTMFRNPVSRLVSVRPTSS